MRNVTNISQLASAPSTLNIQSAAVQSMSSQPVSVPGSVVMSLPNVIPGQSMTIPGNVSMPRNALSIGQPVPGVLNPHQLSAPMNVFQQQRLPTNPPQHSFNQMGVQVSQQQVIMSQPTQNPGTMTVTQPQQPMMSFAQSQSLAPGQNSNIMGQPPVNIVTPTITPVLRNLQPPAATAANPFLSAPVMNAGSSFIDNMPVDTQGIIDPSPDIASQQQQQRTIWTGMYSSLLISM